MSLRQAKEAKLGELYEYGCHFSAYYFQVGLKGSQKEAQNPYLGHTKDALLLG